MGVLGKIWQLNSLRRYPKTLRKAAFNSLKNRRAWREDIDRQDWLSIFKPCEFTRDLTIKQAAPFWWGAFRDKRLSIKDYLDIGSWEGQSAVFAAWLFPNAKITAADWFANVRAVELSDRYTSSFSERVEKKKGTSWDVLSQLHKVGRTFDVILIDADHRFDAVLIDTIKSWPLLRVGGYLIWDDYLWTNEQVKYLSPKPAIDSWVYSRRNLIQPVFADYQICVRKIGSDPELIDMAWFADPHQVSGH